MRRPARECWAKAIVATGRACRVSCRAGKGREEGPSLFAAVCFPSLTMRATRAQQAGAGYLQSYSDRERGRAKHRLRHTEPARCRIGRGQHRRTRPSRPPFPLYPGAAPGFPHADRIRPVSDRGRRLSISSEVCRCAVAQYLALMLQRRPHLFLFYPSCILHPLLLASIPNRP